MSQRLGSARPMQSRSKIIGWANGCPVWSIAGGEGEGDTGASSGTGGAAGDSGSGAGSGQNSGTGSEGQGGTGKEGTEGGDGQQKSGDTVSRAEYDQLVERMKAADRNKSAVETKLKEYEDKDKDELTKATEKAQTLEQTVQQKDATIKAQAVKLAFMTAASHITWHDPADALEFAMKDLRDLEVAEDGTVDAKAVKAAADKLAKDKSYLVKGNTSQGGGSSGSGASGQRVGAGSGSSDKDKLERDKLASKYPALRR